MGIEEPSFYLKF